MSDTPTDHTDNLTRLARIAGQVRGIQRMVEEQAYCIDIMTQIQAVQSALGAVGRMVLKKHLETCVANAIRSKSEDATDEKIQELMTVITRMCK